MKDLLSHASSGRDDLYIIISVCIGIVVLSSAFIVGLLIHVIRDKSYVTAIFADIRRDEVEKIIHHAQSLPITNVQFRARHVLESEGDEEKFWKATVRRYRTTAPRKSHKKVAVILQKEKEELENESEKPDMTHDKTHQVEDSTEAKQKASTTALIAVGPSESERAAARKSMLSQIEYSMSL